MSNVKGRELNSGKLIYSPSNGVENFINILDCDSILTKCMVIFFGFTLLKIYTSQPPILTYFSLSFILSDILGKSGGMNSKEKPEHVPISSGIQLFPLN